MNHEITLSKVLANSVISVSKEQEKVDIKKKGLTDEEKIRREVLLKQYEDEELIEEADDRYFFLLLLRT